VVDEQEPIRPTGEVMPPDVSVESDSRLHNPYITALAIAVVADLLQLVIFPLFIEGAFSPMDDLLDVAIGVMMVKLVGWHWAFLPSFLGKLIPFADELPCWTMAVLYVRAAERAKLNSEQAAV
jgi:hypothetical protein